MKSALPNSPQCGSRRARWGGLGCLCALWLAGCAGGAGVAGSAGGKPPFRDAAMSMQAANASITSGKSTQAEVLAALGPATIVKFDSGFEVWVYRNPPSGAGADRAEFVILFAPSGVVSKTRIRPAVDGPKPD